MMKRTKCGIAGLILQLALVFATFSTSQSLFAADTRCAVLEVFLSDSEMSRAARLFVEKTYLKQAGLTVLFRDVKKNDADLDRYWKLIDHYKIQKPGLPVFHVSGRLELGWDPVTSPMRLAEALTVEVFVREGCTRCQAAHPVLFQRLAPRYPGYRFVERDIENAMQAQRLQELAQRYQVQATSVPAVHFRGRLMVGFLDAETSFQQWDAVLKAVTVACPPAAAAPATRSQEPGSQKQDSQSQRGRPVRPSSPFSFGGSVWAAEPVAPQAEQPSSEPPPLELPPRRPDAATLSAKPQNDDAVQVEPPPPRRPDPDSGPATTPPVDMPPLDGTATSDTIMLPLLGEVRWQDWGLPAFTVVVGLIDGFNPCAMWVLLFLLSLLVNMHDRRKILAVAGTFVVISGLAYFAFMAAWLNVFQLIGILRPVQVILGLLGIAVGSIHIKDYFAFHKGVSLSIPESAKPGLYDRMRKIVQAESLLSAVLGASVLAVLVNIVELLCTAGLPAMYTGILSLQNFAPWKNYAYLTLYILAYMFDDALMVTIVVVTLGRHKLQERGGRILKLISGVVILVLGTIMLFRPDWLV